jgi:hypothetical protein
MARRLFSISAAALLLAVAARQPFMPLGLSEPRVSYIVSEDSGGEIIRYLFKVAQVRETVARVKIAGRCDSACTLFLSLTQDKLCLTPQAYFRFHLPLAEDAETVREAEHVLLMKYPEWVTSWIAAKGGLTQDLITMDYETARQHVPTCEDQIALG